MLPKCRKLLLVQNIEPNGGVGRANRGRFFLKIQGYLKECDIKNIHTYKEFVDSNCNIIILIYDCEFVEIYSKNESTSILLFRRAKALGYKSCGYITDDNDSRTKMDVL